MRRVLVLLPLIAAPLPAQVLGETPTGAGATDPAATAAFKPYGNGCSGSTLPPGADVVTPSSLANAFGGTNNNIPFSWTPCRYQQVYPNADLKGPPVYMGIRLRQDNAFANFDAHAVELEIILGSTTFNAATITGTFATNHNGSVNAMTVFKRRKFAYPKMSPNKPTNPKDFFLTIPFDGPWLNALKTTDNLLLEVKNYGNSNSNRIFTFPLDADRNPATTRIYGLGGPNSPTGSMTRSYGHMIAMIPAGRLAPPPLKVYGANRPRLGQSFHFQLINAGKNARGALILGASNKKSGPFNLPFDLTPLGAPKCFLLASMDNALIGVTAGPRGDVQTTFSIPNNTWLDGKSVYVQFAMLDRANALGVVTSNGGELLFGN